MAAISAIDDEDKEAGLVWSGPIYIGWDDMGITPLYAVADRYQAPDRKTEFNVY